MHLVALLILVVSTAQVALAQGHWNSRACLLDRRQAGRVGPPVRPLPQIENPEFVRAVGKGNLKEVERLLRSGVNVNSVWFGESAFTTAAKSSNLEMMRLLAQYGANAHHLNTSHMNAANWVASRGDVEMMKYLITLGVDIQNISAGCNRPIHDAAIKGHVGVVALLVRYGADIRGGGVKASSPANRAAEGGHVELMQFFLKQGIRLNDQDDFRGEPMLFWAAYGAHLEAVEWLLKNHANPNQASRGGATPLFMAAKANNPEVIQALIRAGAMVDAENGLGETPLFYAIVSRNIANIRLLIRHGANVSNRTRGGTTPMRIACGLWPNESQDRDQIVQLLRNSGAYGKCSWEKYRSLNADPSTQVEEQEFGGF